MSLGSYQKTACMTLDRLPTSVLANVLCQLNTITGSEGVLNEADIPVLMRYITNVSLTCKSMYQAVNCHQSTRVFLDAVAKKYQKSQAFFAATLGTPGTREWLWTYTIQNGYKETYDTIQDIYELAANVQQKAKDAGLSFNVLEGTRKERPNPFYSQTKTGFFLLASSSPDSLATPFGRIKICGACSGKSEDFLSVTEMFIRRLNAVFVENPDRPASENDDYSLFPVSSDESDSFSKISYDAGTRDAASRLKDLTGKRVMVVSSYATTMYAIQRVGNRILSPGSWPSSGQECEVLHTMWEMLEKQRLGQNFIGQNKKVKAPVRSSDSKIHGHLRDISKHAIDLVEQLAQQPLSTTKLWKSVNSKVLSLKNYHEGHGLVLLNKAAKQFLPENTCWHIHVFGLANDRRYKEGEDLGEGLELLRPQDSKRCDLQKLKAAYDTVLTRLGQNWGKAKLRDFPCILHRESEEDYLLFVKKQSEFPQEDVLVASVAQDLGIEEYVNCDSNWKDQSRGLYLWIKKDKFDQVSKALELTYFAHS